MLTKVVPHHLWKVCLCIKALVWYMVTACLSVPWVGKNGGQNQNLLPEQAECSEDGPGSIPGEGGEEKCIVGGEDQGGFTHRSFRLFWI